MPLDPELSAYLEQVRNQPPRSSLSVEQTRELIVRNHALSECSPPLPHVENLQLKCGIPARQYWPEHDHNLPLTVFFHGGRFISGCIESHDSMCRFLALFSGSRILSVDYRLAPEHPFPAAAEDAIRATEDARAMARNVAVAGDSAGACLAGVAALSCQWVVSQVLLYPMLDPLCSGESHRDFGTGFGPGSDDMRRGWELYRPHPGDRRASPLCWSDTGGAPAAFILTCEYDPLRDEGEELARKLQSAGVDTVLRRYPGAIHGFAGMTALSQAGRYAIVDAGEYLQERFRRASS